MFSVMLVTPPIQEAVLHAVAGYEHYTPRGSTTGRQCCPHCSSTQHVCHHMAQKYHEIIRFVCRPSPVSVYELEDHRLTAGEAS